jgi:RNA polymerase sigma factor (sigma-70 family)
MPHAGLRIIREDDDVGGRRLMRPATFDEFFEQQSDALFRRMWLITRNRQEAEEVMQDAFLSVFERWERVSTMEDPTGYLYRTAFNAWKKRLRRASRAVRLAVSPATERDDIEAVEARSIVGSALEALTPRQRAALVLTELLGYSSDEAGAILGIRAVTARVLASQARAAMRDHVGAIDG